MNPKKKIILIACIILCALLFPVCHLFAYESVSQLILLFIIAVLLSFFLHRKR